MKRTLLLLLLGCGDPEAIPGTQVRMEFAADEPFAAPFPSEHLRREDGTVDVSRFPNPKGVFFVRELKRALAGEIGFGITSGIFFTMNAPPEGALPSLQDSLRDDSPIALIAIADGARTPITVDFREDGGPHGAPNLLSILPLQGAPLLPDSLYAVAIRRSIASGVSKEMRALIEGDRPEGLSEAAFEAYRQALDAIDDPEDLAAIAVFRTGDPTAGMARAIAAAPLPAIEAPLALSEIFDDYCVLHTTARMPVYQRGEPPYAEEGGEWTFERGAPVQDHEERANLWLTIPRAAAPASGYPTVVFVRTGGGGDRPLVDRGVQAIAHGPPIEAGAGPARTFARAGWAGLSIDGPHGGLRNVTGGDEQLLIFNFANPIAMRDNIRQSALEVELAGRMIAELTATSSCPGASAIDLDEHRVALMGHSMGATIAPLATISGRFDGLILSGAGGSWIENVIYKESPLRVKGIAELLLEYDGRELHPHDPVLSLLQWAGEPADPQAYPSRMSVAHVLMFQGIVDTYILPPIANASSLAFGLMPAEPVIEPSVAELSELLGRRTVQLPSDENVVVQYPEDGIEDGHEIAFQREEPKHQYGCFLASLARGTPMVPPGAPEATLCPE